MAIFMSAAPAAESARDEGIDIEEVLGLLPEAETYRGQDKWFHILDLMRRMTGEVAYVEKFIRSMIHDRNDFDLKDGYRDTSVVLDSVNGYGIRLNKWKPFGHRQIDMQTDVGLTYDLAHNHDFQLLTKGIWGSGYQTDLYRFESDTALGAFDEAVDLRFQGRLQLTKGSVLWFEEFRDVHVQRPPDELSLSLNFIPLGRTVRNGQLFFDTETAKVTGFPQTAYVQLLALVDLLCDLGQGEDVLDISYEIAGRAKNRWFKIAMANLIAERWDRPRGEVLDRLELRDDDRLLALPGEAFSPLHIL